MIGSSDDDLKLLIAKRFIIPFESGIVVIKHWKIHNYIQKDRYKATVYQEEKSLLGLKENNAYTLDTECIHNGYKTKKPYFSTVSEFSPCFLMSFTRFFCRTGPTTTISHIKATFSLLSVLFYPALQSIKPSESFYFRAFSQY